MIRLGRNDDNYRPDQTSRTLSDLHKKFDKENQEKLESSVKDTDKKEAGVGGGGYDFTIDAKFASEVTKAGSIRQRKVKKIVG